jgi:hypothetical protein
MLKFSEDLMAYFLWIRHGGRENDAFNNYSIVMCVFVAGGTCLSSLCVAKMGGIHIQTHRLVVGIYEVRC